MFWFIFLVTFFFVVYKYTVKTLSLPIISSIGQGDAVDASLFAREVDKAEVAGTNAHGAVSMSQGDEKLSDEEDPIAITIFLDLCASLLSRLAIEEALEHVGLRRNGVLEICKHM